MPARAVAEVSTTLEPLVDDVHTVTTRREVHFAVAAVRNEAARDVEASSDRVAVDWD